MARTYYMSIYLNFLTATIRNSRGEIAYYRCCMWADRPQDKELHA